MKSFKELLEAKRTIEPPKNSPEAKFKAKATKGLIKISEKEFWSPESIKKTHGCIAPNSVSRCPISISLAF